VIVAGLTGSIGMGKSTVSEMFADLGVPVFDADAAVHRLYGPGGAAARAIEAEFPGVVGPNGVDRAKLRDRIQDDPAALRRLEAIVHPLVAAERRRWLRRRKRRGAPVVLLDIPLLFETGGDELVDVVIVVSAPEDVQRRRVLSRPGMTEDAFAAILARQTPDSEKRARADVVIDTSGPFPATRRQVRRVLRRLQRRARATE
jgi:dephospho-CoA kinase